MFDRFRKIPIQYMWAFVIFFAILDLSTTYVGINSGLMENNPVGNMLLQEGFLYLIITKFMIISTLYISNKKFCPTQWNFISPLLIILFWGGASIINIVMIVSVL